MSTNINMLRIKTKLHELFQDYLDMSDIDSNPTDNKHFETRSLAALSLIMKSSIDLQTSCLHITDGFHDMGMVINYLQKTYDIIKEIPM